MKPDPERDRQHEVALTPRGADPLTPWKLTVNDKRLLRSYGIKADADPPKTDPQAE